MSTKRLYMKNMNQLKCTARVMDSFIMNGKNVIILNQSIFYPKGGGQPCDTGIIKAKNNSFIMKVNEVICQEGVVYHHGNIIKGIATKANEIESIINTDRRKLNSRLHSAGHLIDLTIKKLSLNALPIKGYHYPDGSYVEYEIQDINTFIPNDSLKNTIESICNNLIAQDIPITISFDKNKKLNDKPVRHINFGNDYSPCGGTHVSSTQKIGTISIKKIKRKKNIIRISYTLM